jgi:hypothetical protein
MVCCHAVIVQDASPSRTCCCCCLSPPSCCLGRTLYCRASVARLVHPPTPSISPTTTKPISQPVLLLLVLPLLPAACPLFPCLPLPAPHHPPCCLPLPPRHPLLALLYQTPTPPPTHTHSHTPAEWVLVDAAASAYSLVSVPLYDTLGPDAVEYIVNHAELGAVACSAAVLPTLLSCVARCPSLKLLVRRRGGGGRGGEGGWGCRC